MIKEFILLECQTKSGSKDKRPTCFFFFQELYSFYLDHIDFINLTREIPFVPRNIKTFMKIVHELKVNKLNVFEMSFLCSTCLKGSMEKTNLKDFTTEKADDLKMYEKWLMILKCMKNDLQIKFHI